MPLAFHGVNGILAEVLYYPLKKRSIEIHDNIILREFLCHKNLGWCPSVHIVDHMVYRITETRRHRFWQWANLGEAVSNKLQALHILVHLRDKVIIRIILLQYLYPGHKTGYRCTQLMCGLLWQTDPHLVLFCFLWCQQSEYSHYNKYKHYSKLHIRIIRQTFQYRGIIIAYIHISLLISIIHRDSDESASVIKTLSQMRHIRNTVLLRTVAYINVSAYLHKSLIIKHDNGNGIVVVHHFQYKPQISGLVGHIERAHCVRPNFHLVAFLLSEVLYKDIWDYQGCYRYYNSRQHENDLNLPYSICPLHIIVTEITTIYCNTNVCKDILRTQ